MPAGGDGDQPADFLVVATVRRPHGIRGEIFVALETDRPKVVFRPGRVLALGDAAGRPVGGSLTVVRARPQKDGLLLTVAEHTTRDAALEALRGRSLMIPVAEAAPAAGEEIHYRELRGMEIYRGEERVGVVEGVLETAAGEVLVVRRPQRGELLLPFVKEWFPAIDRAARRMTIEPPEGLLEL